MKKVWYLSTCDTSRRIIREFDLKGRGFDMQDIKKEPVTPDQLELMQELAGSYEAVFSRLARKYKALGLKDKKFGEADYRDLILSDYTFLKRPVIIIDNQLFAGSQKKTLAALQEALQAL